MKNLSDDFAGELADLLDALSELRVGGGGEVDAEAVAGQLAVGQERVAGNDADLALGQLLAEVEHVDALGQVTPDEQTALDLVVADAGGHDVLVEELSECIPSEIDVQHEYDNRQLSELLNRFLLSLDEEKRRIFVRRYFYSDSVDGIARRMRISEGKVKSVLFRTRNALRKFLEEEGVAL